MKKTLTVFFMMIAGWLSCFAGDDDFAVAKIPAALLKDAHVVKRLEEFRYQVYSLGKAKLYHRYVITVLDENGDRYASFYEYYDRLRSIEGIEGMLYDASGKKIKSLKKNDIEDRSGVSEISLMEDNRLKYHNFYYKGYPYTVEYESEITYNNTYMFPSWEPQEDEHYAVEQSRFTIVCPADFHFHYKAFNYKAEPSVSREKDVKTYT